MAAFTEGFVDTTGSKDHIGKVISKVLAARQMAEEEREKAQTTLSKQDPDATLEDFGIKRGFFFKKALQFEFGGDFVDQKRKGVKNIIDRAKGLKQPGGLKKEVKDFLKQNIDTKKSSRFSEKFDYNLKIDVPNASGAEPKDEAVPSTTKRVQKATRGSGSRISREDILTSITKIAESLEKTAGSINSSVTQNTQVISGNTTLQEGLIDQLKSRTDTIEDKLQRIVDAIQNQTQFQKQSIDKAENVQTEQKLEQQVDSSSTFNFDDIATKQDESSQASSSAQQDIAATSTQSIEHQQMDAYSNQGIPQAETGGILSGPDSGYLAKLHGDEMVVPIDNNYTQGEPSAMDGKVRPKPSEPKSSTAMIPSPVRKYETGTKQPSMTTPRSSAVGGSMGFNITNMTGIAGGGTTEASKMAQPLMDAMSLPMLVAGGTVLSATTKFMNSMGDEGGVMKPAFQKVSSSIASVFGLPPSITKITKKGGSGQDGKQTDKGILKKLLDGFGTILKALGNSIKNTKPDPSPTQTPGTTGPGVDFSGNKPSVEIPVKQSVMNQFESTENWSTYRETLASKESGGSYSPPPTPGGSGGGGAGGNYEGRYQINHDYLDDIAGKLGEKTPTREQFRKDPKMQERFMQEYTMDNRRILEASSPKFKKMTKKEQMAVLAYAHSQGAGAAANWVESGMGAGTADAFGTKGRTYYENVKNNLNKPTSSAANLTSTKQASQSITQNFGVATNEKLPFQFDGKQYHGYKTTVGWDIYGPSGLVDTSGGKNPKLVDALIKAGQDHVQSITKPTPPKSQEAAFNPPSPQSTQVALNIPAQSNNPSTNIINLGTSATKPSTNFNPPTTSTAAVSGKSQNSDLMGLYNLHTV